MRLQFPLLTFLAFLCVSISSVSTAQDSAPIEAGRANALQLIGMAQETLAQVVMTAQADSGTRPASPGLKSFWQGLQRLDQALNLALSGAQQKDDNFPTGLALAGAAHSQAEIALLMMDAGSDALYEQMDSLWTILNRLTVSYGRGAVRSRQSAELTPVERKQLSFLRQQQKVLWPHQVRIEKALAADNRTILRGIKKIQIYSEYVGRARYALPDFVEAMDSAQTLCGVVWNWQFWWGSQGLWIPGWVDTNLELWLTGWSDLDYDPEVSLMMVDISDLKLNALSMGEQDLAKAKELLESGDFSLTRADLQAMTGNRPGNWREFSTKANDEIMNQVRDNSDQVLFSGPWDVHILDDVGAGNP